MAASDYVPIFFKNRLHLAGRPQMGSRHRPPSPRVPADLPDGQITWNPVQPLSQNISLRRLLETPLVIPAVPPRIKGRIAIVTNVGCGMQWTRVAAQDGRGRRGRRSRVVLAPRCWRQLGVNFGVISVFVPTLGVC
jgi:hypothetical protein